MNRNRQLCIFLNEIIIYCLVSLFRTNNNDSSMMIYISTTIRRNCSDSFSLKIHNLFVLTRTSVLPYRVWITEHALCTVPSTETTSYHTCSDVRIYSTVQVNFRERKTEGHVNTKSPHKINHW